MPILVEVGNDVDDHLRCLVTKLMQPFREAGEGRVDVAHARREIGLGLPSMENRYVMSTLRQQRHYTGTDEACPAQN